NSRTVFRSETLISGREFVCMGSSVIIRHGREGEATSSRGTMPRGERQGTELPPGPPRHRAGGGGGRMGSPAKVKPGRVNPQDGAEQAGSARGSPVEYLGQNGLRGGGCPEGATDNIGFSGGLSIASGRDGRIFSIRAGRRRGKGADERDAAPGS